MEPSPAKSLEVISDSEGEEDQARANGRLNQPQRDSNAVAEISSVSRDRQHHHTTSTMSSHIPSSHISMFPTMPYAQPPTASIDSSIQPGSDSAATNPRPRPRPRMRPVPPPDDPDTSIGAFSTIPPSLAQPPTDTVSSFDNSAVRDVPYARPPSLPPSSFPAVDLSSPIPQTTLPITAAPQEKAKPVSKSKPHNPTNVTTGATSSNTIPAPVSIEPLAFPSSKRPRPKMRPPPPPEPTPSNSTTAPSVAATDSSSNLKANPSTSATSNSANSKTSSAQQRSALDDAEVYTGRGARRLAQMSKPDTKVDDYIDVGGPEDEVIMLLDSSDGERPPLKPKAKPKKKVAPKPTNKSVPTEAQTPGDEPGPSSRAPPATASRAKRKSPQPQTSDDELGRWDIPVPGEPASASARAAGNKKRKKAAIQDSDDEGPNPSLPPHVPDASVFPGNRSDPPHPPAPSSPLSSPGHSPVAKRKLDSSTVEEVPAPTTAKKPRKSTGKMEIVLRAPPVQDNPLKKPKAKPKGRGKLASSAPIEPGDVEVEIQSPSVLDTAAAAPDGSIPGATPQPVDDNAGSSTTTAPVGMAPASAETEPTPTTGKKPAKKKVARGKKGAAAAAAVETPAEEGATETPTTAVKKPAKGKGRAKAKDTVTVVGPSDAGTAPVIPDTVPSNPNAGATASLSNPSTNSNPEAGSSNPPAPNQTPAAKPSRSKPRHSTTPAPMPVAMGASGALVRSTGGKSSDRPLSETLRLTLGGTGTPSPRVGLSRRGSNKIAPLLAFRGAPPPPPPPMPKKPVRKKKGQSDDEDSEEGPEWEGLTEKQKEKKRREKEVAGWYSD